MDAFNRMRLAQYYNRRGVRMLKCASGVDHCNHKQAFQRLAKECFEARDYQMGQARLELGLPKVFLYQIESLDFEGRMHGDFPGVDELDAGQGFEQQCESLGLDPGIYRAVRFKRVRL